MASLVPQSVEWDSGGEHVQLCQIPVNPEDHSMFPLMQPSDLVYD